ncbi:MAG TPA: HEAT repeat domain-containing protein [Nitrospiria bacterium]
MELNNQEAMRQIRDADPELRLRALDHLSRSGDSQFVPELIGLLGDPEWRVRKSAVMAVAGLERNPNLAERLISVLEEGNVGKRNAALEALIHFGAAALPPILARLRRTNKDVKKMILEIVGEIGDPQAVPDLLPMLEDPDENVRMAAIESLGKLKDRRSVPVMLPLLRSDDPLIGFVAIKALERLGDPRAVEPLLEIVNKKGMERAALDALGTFSDPAVQPPILAGLKAGGRKIRESALKALITHYDRLAPSRQAPLVENLKRSYDKELGLFLIESLDSRDERLRLSAVRLIGWAADTAGAQKIASLIDGPLYEEALSALIQMKQEATDVLIRAAASGSEAVREGIARILGETGGGKAAQALIRLLLDPNGHVRQTSARSLGRLRDPAAAGPLLNLLTDPYAGVQDAAIDALGAIALPESVARLVERLGSDNPVLRGNAVKALGKMNASEALPRLSIGLKDEDATVRQAAVEALAGFNNPEVVRLISLALGDEEKAVRLAALSAIIRHPAGNLLQHIEPLLRDDNIWVRAAVAKGLGDRRSEAAEALLLRLLKDKVGVVQISAIEALVKYQDPRLIQALEALTADRDTDVVRTAIQGLGRIGDATISKRLHSFLTHSNWGIRAAAAQALGKLRDKEARETLKKIAKDDLERLVRLAAENALGDMEEST